MFNNFSLSVCHGINLHLAPNLELWQRFAGILKHSIIETAPV